MAEIASYVKPGRLADVLALIQVLAYDRETDRSEEALRQELQRRPGTAASWIDLARAHPEFFRVRGAERLETSRISLISRCVLDSEERADGENTRQPLEAEVVTTLMEMAIQLHDKQAAHRERWTTFIPALSVLLAVIGLLVTAWESRVQQGNWERTYSDQQKKDQEDRKTDQEHDAQLQDRELFKPLWEKQISLTLEAADVAATIATSTDEARRAAATERFWVLHEGPLIVVESQGVSGAMKSFGRCLRRDAATAPQEDCTPDTLRERSRTLATEVLEALSQSWAQGLGGFSEGKFKYH